MALCLTALVYPAAQARPDGKLDFRFVCKLGRDRAIVSTENGLARYRYISQGQVKLDIREDKSKRNAFYRYDLVGLSGSSQQVRFVRGRHSYGISSLFIAQGRADWAALFVAHDNKLLRWEKCEGTDSFNEDHQLDRLQKDPLGNFALSVAEPY